MTSVRPALIVAFFTLAIAGCSKNSPETARTKGAEQAERALPELVLPQTDQCSSKHVQFAVLKAARDEIGTMLRGAMGWKYFVPNTREDANRDAFTALNLTINRTTPTPGYDKWRYFRLENARLTKNNTDTGVFRCEFVIRIYGSASENRTVPVLVGPDDLTAKKVPFLLAAEDMVLTASAIIKQSDLDSYKDKTDESFLDEEGRLTMFAFGNLTTRLQWESLKLGNLGTVVIGSGSERAIGRAENAAIPLFESPIARKWSANYRFEGTSGVAASARSADTKSPSEAEVDDETSDPGIIPREVIEESAPIADAGDAAYFEEWNATCEVTKKGEAFCRCVFEQIKSVYSHETFSDAVQNQDQGLYRTIGGAGAQCANQQ